MAKRLSHPAAAHVPAAFGRALRVALKTALCLAFLVSGCGATMTAEAPSGNGGPSSGSESATRSADMSDIIFVVPLVGAPTRTSLILADTIAAEIRDSNHPAILAHEPNQAGASIVGEIVSAETRGAVQWIGVDWSVRAPYGTHVATYHQQVVIDSALWERGAPEAINLLVGDAAPKILEMVRTHVGPPSIAAMTHPGDGKRAPSPPTSSPDPLPSAASAPIDPTPQPLARIGEATSGQVVHAPGAPAPAPSTPAAAPQEEIPPPSELPSLLTPKPVNQTAAQPSGPPRPLKPGEAVVGAAPGVVDSAEKPAEEDGGGLLDSLLPSMDTETRRPDDARPPGPGGAAFAGVRWGQPAFLIRPVKGAPGNGNEALTAGLKSALRARDLTISEDPRQAGFVIDGVVDIGAPVNGRQYVKIVWHVTTVTGEEVGKAVQENTIVAGSLDGEWGHVAEVVSGAAVRGIQDLFGEADTRLRDRERLPEFPDVALPAEPGRAPPPPTY